MALLKAFVCQIVLLGLYKLFLEQVIEDHLVPDELTRNCLVGFVCLLCFGIQLYTEKVEEQASQSASSKAKSRRRTPPDTAESVSEFLDARTAHMMRTLDAAMQHMNQMPASDGYVQNVIFAAAGPEAAVIEQTFSKSPDVVDIEEIHMTKLDDAIYAKEKDEEKFKVSANEPIAVPFKVEESERNDKNESEEEEEEVEEEETETKSDVCEEEEEDVVTVIDASKPKSEATESAEEEEEEEEEEKESTADNKKNVQVEEKPVVKPSKVEDEEEEEEEEEEESEEEETEVKKETGKVTKTS